MVQDTDLCTVLWRCVDVDEPGGRGLLAGLAAHGAGFGAGGTGRILGDVGVSWRYLSLLSELMLMLLRLPERAMDLCLMVMILVVVMVLVVVVVLVMVVVLMVVMVVLLVVMVMVGDCGGDGGRANALCHLNRVVVWVGGRVLGDMGLQWVVVVLG